MKSGLLVEIQPETTCWPVEITNGRITGRPVSEGNPPKTKAFYWAWSHDSGPHHLEGRLIPREPIIGLSLGKKARLWIKLGLERGDHMLSLFYTDTHGIVAAHGEHVKILHKR